MAHDHIKLDADLYPVYASYKKATNAVVRWIATAASGDDLGPDRTKWTLKELRLAATNITKSKGTDISLRIPCAFQSAIEARKEITVFYRHNTKIDSIETKKHERFTETLKEIYKFVAHNPTRTGPPVVEQTRPLPLTLTNAYASLASVPTKDTNASAEDAAAEEGTCTSDEESSNLPAKSPEQSFGLKDDGLADMFEIYYVVTHNLDLACTEIKDVWAKAAAGSISIVFSAWLTTAAVECLRSRFNGGSFSVSPNPTNHQELYDRYKSFLGINGQDSSVTQLLTRDSPQSGIFSSGHGLFCPAEAIIRGESTQLEENTHEVAVFEKPEYFVTVEECADDKERQYRAESVVMDKVLKSIKRRLLASEDIRPEFLYNMNPLIKDIQNIYRAKDSSNAPNALIKTNVVFGLQLLVESYKSFMCSIDTLKTVNCRIQMLKFAQDVKNTLAKMRKLRPFIQDKCACDYVCTNQGLRTDICTLELDLMVLTSQNIFDLYYQAPWVAGSHMLEVLSRANRLGVLLCNKNQIVWAVLHVYKLLRQCGALEEETVLLEHLCAAIGERVFRGKPPQRDFWTRYKICNGGRLEFDRSKKQHARHHPSNEDRSCARPGRNWHVTMPKSHSTYANYNHEINAHQTSIFAGLYTYAFSPSCVAWSYAWHGSDRTRFPQDEDVRKVAAEIAAHPLVFALDHLESALEPELQGNFPMGRLNWFEVFLTMTEVLSEMGRSAHVECIECRKSPRDAELWIMNGCCAMEKLMQRADKYEDIGISDFCSESLGNVEPARNAICGAVRGKTTGDYLWNV